MQVGATVELAHGMLTIPVHRYESVAEPVDRVGSSRASRYAGGTAGVATNHLAPTFWPVVIPGAVSFVHVYSGQPL